MRHVLRSQGDRRRYQCLLDTVSGGASGRDRKEDTDDVNSGTAPSGILVLVLEVQVGVIADQLSVG